MRAAFDAYKDRGLLATILVVDGSESETYFSATQDDLNSIATANGIGGGSTYPESFPVVADQAVYYSATADVLLIAPGGEIVTASKTAADIPADEIEALLD